MVVLPVRTGGGHMTESVLEARNLEVTFRGRGNQTARAVDGVDLSLGRGEIVALVGERVRQDHAVPRAARTRSGLRAARSSSTGSRWSTQRGAQEAPAQRTTGPAGSHRGTQSRAVGRCTRLSPRGFGAPFDGDERAAVADASPVPACVPERFFLRYPHELSGGQRQRVVIGGPRPAATQVIIADEPVSSLDASVRGRSWPSCCPLRESLGLSLLVVTHDLGVAWNIADRIAVMYLGRIVRQGPTEGSVRAETPLHRGAACFRRAGDRPRRPIVLTGEPPDPTIPSGCRPPRCPALRDGAAQGGG